MVTNKRKLRHRAMQFAPVVVIIGLIIFFVGSQSWQRSMKSISSDLGGGLERTLTVYDYNGQPIKTYSGKFDVSESENEVYFDLNGKRIIIHGGIVVNEEN